LVTVILFAIWISYARYVIDPKVCSVFRIQTNEFMMDLHEITGRVSALLTSNGIKHCISCGTALGAARYGRAIDHDDDADFFVLKKDLTKIAEIIF
jgi:hypothetical protein